MKYEVEITEKSNGCGWFIFLVIIVGLLAAGGGL